MIMWRKDERWNERYICRHAIVTGKGDCLEADLNAEKVKYSMWSCVALRMCDVTALRWTANCVLILCALDRASSWYLNKGWPTRWHLVYYILLNMFQTLIRPSSGASEYLLCCVGWLEACWCYVAGLAVSDVVSECRRETAYTRIPHHQQPIPLHNISTPQVSLHNTTSTR